MFGVNKELKIVLPRQPPGGQGGGDEERVHEITRALHGAVQDARGLHGEEQDLARDG